MEYSFSFTEAEANLIFQALAKLPYEVSAVLIAKIQKQFADAKDEEEKNKNDGE